MKHLFVLSILLITSTVYAESSKELLTPKQREDIIRTVDNICGDTWCEGDYNFRFNSFTCDKKTTSCELNFQFIKYEGENEKEIFSSEQTCRFNNIKSFNQLMESKYSLNDEFYSAVTDCIWEKEKAIRF